MLSISHLIILFIVALIVFGPRKLPELGRTLGRVLAEFRKVSTDLRRAVEDEMRELDRETRELDRGAREAADPVLQQHALPEGSIPVGSGQVRPGAPSESEAVTAAAGSTSDEKKAIDGKSEPA